MKTKIHIILVAQEGTVSITCGVGMIVANFIYSLPKVIRFYNQNGYSFKVSTISLSRDANSIGYDKKLYKKTSSICLKSGGNMHFIPSKFRENKGYFDIPIWRKYNAIATNLINQIYSRDEITIVLHHDGIFSNLNNINQNIYKVWIPHSLSFIHKQKYSNLTLREKWEQESLKRILAEPKSYIGFISDFPKKILIKKYKVPVKKLVPFLNGLENSFLKRYKKDQLYIKKELKRHNIPVNKEILLAYGRPDEYKGLEITLSNLIKFAHLTNRHVVMVASRFSNEKFVSKIQEKLKNIKSKRETNVTLITEFEFVLPKLLLNWSKTRLLACFSLRDFAPIIPFEAAILGHPDLRVLVSDIDCFRSNFKIDRDILGTKLKSREIQLNLARSLVNNKRNLTINAEFKKKSKSIYNISKNYLIGLQQVMS